ncbi:MAG: LicD family protein [Selenomonadaceae bacterium]|nr:LicD family protein [Selenomonadaceae bacterium]
MAKKPGNFDAIVLQNKLLQEQNISLRSQNELLRQAAFAIKGDKGKQNERSGQSSLIDKKDEREIFIDDIYHDEMREGFLVTSHRKKLWNVQIGILQEFARICKKHDIRWFTIGGTLLGAVRHKGFIPWDDDVDVIMFRPDYEKFKSVVEEELTYNPHYSMWYWFNHRLESDSEAAQHANSDLPFISRAYANKYAGLSPFFPLLRLVDERTTCYLNEERKSIFYAIWIDIFCFDPCPPFEDRTLLNNFNMAQELFLATIYPEKVKEALENKEKFLIPRDKMMTFLNLPFKTRAQQFDLFSLKHYTKTPYVSEMAYQTIRKRKRAYRAKSFDDVIYLPFEKIEVPVPADYDAVLTDDFGDWHKIVVASGHLNTFSADIPYREYFAKSKVKE